MDARAVDGALERLLALELEGRLPDVVSFWSHEERAPRPGPWVLSHWWPCELVIDDVAYDNAEAALMAAKARLFGDAVTFERILESRHPSEAQRAGREVRPFDEATWERHRFAIAVRVNTAKFTQHPQLGRYLCSTAPRTLVETNPRDLIWGAGIAADDLRVHRPSEWPGRNLLGFALEEVRRCLLEDARRAEGP